MSLHEHIARIEAELLGMHQQAGASNLNWHGLTSAVNDASAEAKASPEVPDPEPPAEAPPNPTEAEAVEAS